MGEEDGVADGVKTAVRSRRMRMLECPESGERMKSLVTLRSAVSVL